MEKLIIILANIHYLLFLRDIYEACLSLEHADSEQSNFALELKKFSEDIKAVEKKFFEINLVLFFGAREKVLNNFKSR